MSRVSMIGVIGVILSISISGCAGSRYRANPSPPNPALQRENARLEREHEEKVARKKANPDGVDDADEKSHESIKDRFTSCFNKLADDQSLKAIKGKLAMIPKADQPFDILTNSSRPTKNEKVAIRVYSQGALACMNILDGPLKAAPPEAREAFNGSKNGMQTLLASLYLGNISYGGYAKALTELLNQEGKAYARAIGEQQRDAQNRENIMAQQEIERNRAYSASQQARATEDLVSAQRTSNWLQIMNSMNNSSYRSNSINCTSNQYFGTVHTSCY